PSGWHLLDRAGALPQPAGLRPQRLRTLLGRSTGGRASAASQDLPSNAPRIDRDGSDLERRGAGWARYNAATADGPNAGAAVKDARNARRLVAVFAAAVVAGATGAAAAAAPVRS